jgi:hypothetical protein
MLSSSRSRAIRTLEKGMMVVCHGTSGVVARRARPWPETGPSTRTPGHPPGGPDPITASSRSAPVRRGPRALRGSAVAPLRGLPARPACGPPRAPSRGSRAPLGPRVARATASAIVTSASSTGPGASGRCRGSSSRPESRALGGRELSLWRRRGRPSSSSATPSRLLQLGMAPVAAPALAREVGGGAGFLRCSRWRTTCASALVAVSSSTQSSRSVRSTSASPSGLVARRAAARARAAASPRRARGSASGTRAGGSRRARPRRARRACGRARGARPATRRTRQRSRRVFLAIVQSPSSAREQAGAGGVLAPLRAELASCCASCAL